MQFSARQIFWLAFCSVALQGLTSLSWGTVPVPASYHWVFTFSASLISYGQGLVLWIIGTQGTQVNGLPKIEQQAGALKPVLLFIIVGTAALLLCGPPAYAQKPAPAAPSAATIWQKIATAAVSDLQYASTLAGNANTNSSRVRKQCWDALLAANKRIAAKTLSDANGNVVQPSLPAHIFTDAEQLSEVVDDLGPNGALFTACAGAAGMAKMNVLQFINAAVSGLASFLTIAPLIP